MNTKTKLSVSDRESNLAIEFNHGKRVLNLGMDTHFRQVTAGMQEDGGRIKAAGKMSYPLFLAWVQKKLDEGWEIYSCYEAGATGYWLHRQLEQMASRTWWWCPRRWVKEARSKRPISAMPGSCAIHWIVICVVMTRAEASADPLSSPDYG